MPIMNYAHKKKETSKVVDEKISLVKNKAITGQNESESLLQLNGPTYLHFR